MNEEEWREMMEFALDGIVIVVISFASLWMGYLCGRFWF